MTHPARNLHTVAAALAALAAACSAAPQAPAPTAGDPRCPDPKPDPGHVCAQACPPRLAHPGDAPPGFVWADPKHVRDGKVHPCPICLPADARIAAPGGDVRAGDVREGMTVWTRDASGRRVPARVELVGATPLGAAHTVVRVALSDGRVVSASPGHPIADGEALGALQPGDRIDGARVLSVARVPYRGERTVDLLPAGPTGIYWADGVPLGSTLRREATLEAP
jgi:hypothetical protein